MAQDSGFFNAQYQDGEYDRVYNAEQFAAYFAAFISNGIFGGNLDELLPLARTVNNMSVDISSGRAWINGWWFFEGIPRPPRLPLTRPPPPGTQNPTKRAERT